MMVENQKREGFEKVMTSSNPTKMLKSKEKLNR